VLVASSYLNYFLLITTCIILIR